MTQDTSTIPETSANQLEFKIEKILVPLDFSPASTQALDYAVWLAKQFRTAIHLVHVYPPDEASAMPGAGHLPSKVTAAPAPFTLHRVRER